MSRQISSVALHQCRQLSSSATTKSTSLTATSASAIQRHGLGDGVITLNVGGKNFQTLRSTVQQNAVLMDHVVRAEANMEITSQAIFIDRDPKHFGLILAYLRNQADGVSRHHGVTRKLLSFGKSVVANQAQSTNATSTSVTNSITSSITACSFIQLPKDNATLTELYFESIHYNIPELSNRICSQQSLTRIFELFGSSNPFQMATSAVAFGKRMLILLGTMATSMGGWVYAQAVLAQEKTNNFLSLPGGNADSEESSVGKEARDSVMKKDTDYWMKQADYWETVAKKWNRGEGSQE